MADMRRWQRPYRFAYATAVGLSWLAIAGAGAVFAVVDLLAGGRWHTVDLVFWVGTVLLFRLVRLGVYVSDAGVRVRNCWWTHTLRWSEVAVVEAVPAGPLGRESVRITTRDGRVVRTPVRRGSPGPWRPATRPSQRGGPTVRVVPSPEFDRLVWLLRTRVRAA
jgi:hypothetical protein